MAGEIIIVHQTKDALADPNVVGFECRRVLESFACDVTRYWIEHKSGFLPSEMTVIGVPRGGVPAAFGASRVLMENGVEVEWVLSNAGEGKDENLFLLKDSDVLADTVLIADYVIGFGGEVSRHIKEVIERSGSRVNRFVIVAAVAAELGINNILSFADRQGIEIDLLIGDKWLEKDCVGWVDGVYWVGVGDAGKMTIKGYKNRQQYLADYQDRFEEL